MPGIGIDTHKRTLAACAVDHVGSVIGERTFSCDPAGFIELAAWAGGNAPEATIGIEGSASYGAPVARHLIAAGFTVREVPPHLSRRERAPWAEALRCLKHRISRPVFRLLQAGQFGSVR